MWSLRKWLAGGVCKCQTKLEGKIVIITGANTGIGYETAKELANRGATVYILCRDLSKGAAAKQSIQTLNPTVKLEVALCDFASLTSVRACADRLNSELSKVDILINNAGVACTPNLKTEDGFEYQFGVNHLGHFLLTNLLMGALQKGAPSRVINVSSIAHIRGRINFDDVNFKRCPYHPFTAYYQSKLANILFTRELAKRQKDKGVTAYCLHPGAVHTELGRYLGDSTGGFVSWLFSTTSRYTFKTSAQGAQTTIHCACAPNIEHQSGQYFVDCQIKEPASQANDVIAAEKLWQLSEQLVNLK